MEITFKKKKWLILISNVIKLYDFIKISYYKTMHLHIKLTQLQLDENKTIEKSYFSFSYNDTMYFSSIFDNKSHKINDDIFIPLEMQPPEVLLLQRWENHMVMFTYELNLEEFKSRRTIKKIYETHQSQLLYITLELLKREEIIFGNKYVSQLGQHYMKIEKISLKNKKTRGQDPGPCYFLIASGGCGQFCAPVQNAVIYIQIPQKIQLFYYRNGQLQGRSAIFNTQNLQKNEMQINLGLNGNQKGTLKAQLQWGINFRKIYINNLVNSQEVLLYDMEVKFQHHSQFANTKIKVAYGQKTFQFGGQFNATKISRFRKIIYFFIKSPAQEINIIVQRNNKPTALAIFFTDQIPFNSSSILKKKLIELASGKFIGNFKCKAQRLKNASIPQNNTLWKELMRKKASIANQVIALEQISVKYSGSQSLMIVVKIEEKQQMLSPVANFQFFQAHNPDYEHPPIILHTKPEQNIYLMLRKASKGKKKQLEEVSESDFIGVAVLNPNYLRLGQNTVCLDFFKNQQQTASMNAVVNKIVPYPFLKYFYQAPLELNNAKKLIGINAFINKIIFTPYYYTYQYDNKKEVYLIIQINGQKKTVILQSSAHDPLNFVSESGSDKLDFVVEEREYTKIKISFVVTNFGEEEQVYANILAKTRTSQLIQQLAYDFTDVSMENNCGLVVGKMSFELHRGVSEFSPSKMTYKNELKTIQKDINEIHKNMSIVQSNANFNNKAEKNKQKNTANFKKQHMRNFSGNKKQSNRYSTQKEKKLNNLLVKLPLIKQKKKSVDVGQFLSMRKRGADGYYQSQNQPDKPITTQRKAKPYSHSFDLKNIQRQNPNIDKNFQMLFPKKSNQIKKKNQQLKNQIIEHENRLKNFKSVYNEIQNDIKSVQPSLKQQSRQNIRDQIADLNSPEWQGNQFI